MYHYPKYTALPFVFSVLFLLSCGGAGNTNRTTLSSEASNIELKYSSTIGPLIKGTAQLNSPVDVAFDVDGNLFICDNGNSRIIKLDPIRNFSRDIGGFGSGNEQLSDPSGICFDHGLTLMVADSHKREIKRFDRNLNFIDSYFEYKTSDGSFKDIGSPQSVYVSRQGDIYIGESENNRVLILDGFYGFHAEVGGFGYGNGELNYPGGMATGRSDYLFVADSRNGRIAVYNNIGEYLGEFGNDRLRYPVDLVVEQRGLILVTDRELKSVLVFSQDGVLIVDSAEQGILFSEPAGIAVSTDNMVYVADRHQNIIVVLEIIR
ncbi:MAG: hypothetical protein GY855_06915 [candidate division Zixibacteria bacterium]|nr:hypothetical protein [candidate division Zixibacteria bacterium]